MIKVIYLLIKTDAFSFVDFLVIMLLALQRAKIIGHMIQIYLAYWQKSPVKPFFVVVGAI